MIPLKSSLWMIATKFSVILFELEKSYNKYMLLTAVLHEVNLKGLFRFNYVNFYCSVQFCIVNIYEGKQHFLNG